MTTGTMSCGHINYPIFIHENIIDDVARAPTLRRRPSLTLQHLASMGTPASSRGAHRPTGDGGALPWAVRAEWHNICSGPTAAARTYPETAISRL